jgi:uncharacterized Ntn-hydrolase superfamily protein
MVRGASIVQAYILITVLIASSGCQATSVTASGSNPSDVALTNDRNTVATFSIVAFDPRTGDLGVAVQSKFFGVGSVVPWARAGVGAIATQAWANVRYGPEGLDLLASGKTALDVVRELTTADAARDKRQIGVVDATGNAAAFTGSACHPWAGHRQGKAYCVQGNILTGEDVVDAMAKTFEAARTERDDENTELADWLMAALRAGQEAGGDKRGRQSAALLIVRDGAGFGGGNDRYIDLRVEDHPQPIKELSRLLSLHREFFIRARNER